MALASDVDNSPADLPFDLKPETPTIGAWVSGIDLSKEQPREVIDGLRAALLEWKVLFFRDQHLSQDQHLALARRFGELEVHPLTDPSQKNPEILRLVHDEAHEGRENIWHSDVSWRAIPSMASILRAVEVPPAGGDTLWADMEAAYEGLPQIVKDEINGAECEHSFLRAYGGFIDASEHAEIREKHPDVIHPVVRTHPETGRRCIYVNLPFTTRILGMEEDKSSKVLELLMNTASRPEYQVRLHWEPGTIAFWDNRSTQHYATNDYYPQRREMERVTIIGDKPFYSV